ncbi:response regulator transcription factor [Arcobacter arenosus]|uniref:Response regulator transcription factor n=1 Tax=Arcobacter arenosus TaxID=2576037 RepID=A0A5R8Y3K0_9BACT|nr:response regulator transcription factor [Arcobacter arenosus]TLP40689.1 response regulator transcription factor [Arcobacter arenosus]
MSKNYSILYAEDNKDVRENYVLYLENYFDYIYEANDGLEAFDIYRDKKPNVLLLDINMPNMNGLELAKKIRENDSNIPIVILSAHSDKEFLFEAIKLNLVEYLTKPVDRNKFKSVLENSIKKVKENAPNNQFIHFAKTTYWDCSKRLFFHKNKMIDLTRNERILFELLLNNKNEIINPNEISKYVWDNETEINDASIRNLVKRLRKKLPVDIIQSIYGSGYILSH